MLFRSVSQSRYGFREKFEAKMHQMFPDVATEGVVSRPQLMEVMGKLKTEKYPLWLMVNKVGRGLYAVGTAAVKEQEVEVQTVDLTNSESLIPKKDPNFVPFGNYGDLEQIIKSAIFYPSYISGPTGNGKSTMVEQICAKHKRPLIRVNLRHIS